MKRNPAAPRVRCAIYTRKSTEEGLEQEFNSLDAQRESAEAYIKSQAHEGWTLLAERYDDGGYTGGNMDRPALARLLADIASGKIDCVVVYKVDRLSRSLLDFARMMETFDKRQVSFVSVTQQFNTGASMGRLVLNVLLSFAQARTRDHQRTDPRQDRRRPSQGKMVRRPLSHRKPRRAYDDRSRAPLRLQHRLPRVASSPAGRGWVRACCFPSAQNGPPLLPPPRMPVSRQRKLEIEKRRLKVAELTLKGCRQAEIAERLGVTQATVSFDLKHLKAAWRAEATQDIAAEVARQLEKLSLLEREAWDAWERSKQPAHSTVVHRGGENEPSKMRQTLKHQTGDVRYLDQVQKCLAAARSLLGLSPAREPLASGDAPAPPSLDTIDARRITLAEALPLLLSDPSYHSAPPPPADHKPSNMIDVDAEYDRLAAEQLAAEQLAADRRRKLKERSREP